MKVKSKIVLLLSCFVFFSRCTTSDKSTIDKVGEKHCKISYAEGFTINDKSTYKIIELLNKNKITSTYVLYNKNTEKPKLTIANCTYVKTPVKKAVVLSSLYVGFLDKLNLIGNIVAIDNVDYISTNKVIQGVQSNAIAQVAIAGKINEEITISLKPDLILTYGSGGMQNDKNNKLSTIGIPSLYCLDHLEKTPLGRAEWIKLIAYFFEKENLADSLFALTEKKYKLLKASAATTSTQPTVLTEIKLNDAWYVPGGKSFMACLINDAHANYCFKNDTTIGSLPLSFEQVYEKASTADYWLNVLFCKSKKDIVKMDTRYANFKAYKNNTIYNNNLIVTPKGGNAYWETGLINPDFILQDMIKIFHPELYKEKAFNYYRKLN